MSYVLAIAGSPSHPSRTYSLLELAAQQLEQANIQTEILSVRDIPAEDLALGRYDSPSWGMGFRVHDLAHTTCHHPKESHDRTAAFHKVKSSVAKHSKRVETHSPPPLLNRQGSLWHSTALHVGSSNTFPAFLLECPGTLV